MNVIACGFDTLRPAWESSEPLPILDEVWQEEMIGCGFESQTGRQLNRCTNQVDEWSSWKYQDQQNSTLRAWVRGARFLTAEFSAPRLKSDSPINLALVSAYDAYGLVEEVRARLASLIPALGTLTLLKFRRADYAVDIETGRTMRDVIASFQHMHLEGSRKAEKVSYRHQGILIKGATQSFSIYPKGIEMEDSLNREERKKYTELIREAKDVGRLRLEYRHNPSSGISTSYLDAAAETVATKLAAGFPNGCSRIVSSVRALIDQVDASSLTYNQKSAILADTLRCGIYGPEYIKQQAKRRTAERRLSNLRELGLHYDEGVSNVIEVDFGPIINALKVA